MQQVTLTRTQAKTVLGLMEQASEGYKGKDLRRLNRLYGVLEPIEDLYIQASKDIPENDEDAITKFLDGYGSEDITLEFESVDYTLIVRMLKAMDKIRGNRRIVRELTAIRDAFGMEDEE